MNFKKWVKRIQTAGYNGARTVHYTKVILLSQFSELLPSTRTDVNHPLITQLTLYHNQEKTVAQATEEILLDNTF